MNDDYNPDRFDEGGDYHDEEDEDDEESGIDLQDEYDRNHP